MGGQPTVCTWYSLLPNKVMVISTKNSGWLTTPTSCCTDDHYLVSFGAVVDARTGVKRIPTHPALFQSVRLPVRKSGPFRVLVMSASLPLSHPDKFFFLATAL